MNAFRMVAFLLPWLFSLSALPSEIPKCQYLKVAGIARKLSDNELLLGDLRYPKTWVVYRSDAIKSFTSSPVEWIGLSYEEAGETAITQTDMRGFDKKWTLPLWLDSDKCRKERDEKKAAQEKIKENDQAAKKLETEVLSRAKKYQPLIDGLKCPKGTASKMNENDLAVACESPNGTRNGPFISFRPKLAGILEKGELKDGKPILVEVYGEGDRVTKKITFDYEKHEATIQSFSESGKENSVSVLKIDENGKVVREGK